MQNTSASSSHSHSVAQGLSISTLRRKRGHIIGQVSSLQKFLDSCQTSGMHDKYLIQSHLDGLNEAWKRFDDIQFNIEELDESEEERRYEIQNSYYAAVARANREISEHSTNPMTRDINPSPATTVLAPLAIKLPEMRLPTFDGTIEKWASFYDLFSSMIDLNESLTPVQKLQYLRSTLTGKAAACIQSLSTTDANYNDAISLLKGKYDCTRRIVLKHCDALQQIPRLNRDTPEALGDLVDHVNQHLRALKNLGENVTEWNSLLVSIILSKINPDTAWHWELTLKDKREIPSYTQLLEFLEKRANCAPPSCSTSVAASGTGLDKSRNFRRGPTREHSFVTAKLPQCAICKEHHGIWHCNRFKNQSVSERLKSIEKASLCINCLGEGHPIDRCRAGSCRVCHKRHHTLLHNSRPTQNTKSVTSYIASDQQRDSATQSSLSTPSLSPTI